LGWAQILFGDSPGYDFGVFRTARQTADIDVVDLISYLSESLGRLLVRLADILKTIGKGAGYDQNI